MALTREQQDVIRGIVKNVRRGEQMTTLGGYAGTGKTTCITFLSEVFPDFSICAYTGKAANVLRKKGLETAQTIHSLIYKAIRDEKGRLEFKLKQPHELSANGFLVDEASMVSKVIYNDLFTFGVPIVFVGDHGQLEPVGQDINVMANPEFRLETVHRNAGEIAHFAEHLRKGYVARTFPARQKVAFAEPAQVNSQMLLGTSQMICAYNRTRVETNNQARQLSNRRALVERGEKIMCLRNNRTRGLFNGMQGVVTRVYKKPKFDFWSDGVTYPEIHYDPNQFGQEKNQFEFGSDSPDPFDYAYCITAHKSQGDEWDNVMVFEQICSKWDHKRWAYTAASRAKTSLIWICPRQLVPSWL